MTFAESGGSIAYPAKVDGRWVVIHGGRAGPPWDGVGSPVLSRDGTRVAYPANGETGWTVMIDDKPGPTFEAIVSGSLGFDSSGGHVGYVGRRGDSSFAVIDGVSSRGWSLASRPIFFDDGSRSAYIGWLGKAAIPVFDGVPSSAHDSIGGVAYSAAQSAWAYATRDSGVWQVVAGAARLGPFDQVRDLIWPRHRIDPRPTFVARAGGAEAVVLDGVAQRWHRRISSLVFQSSGRRWGYIADSGAVYVDGNLAASEMAAADLAISDDGMRFAYVAARGTALEVVEGGARYGFDVIVPATLAFLPGGSWAVLAGDRARRELFVVVDGRRTSRRVDWQELVQMTQLPDPPGALRAMIAAEARLALAKGDSR